MDVCSSVQQLASDVQHSVRGFISGSLGIKMGLPLESAKHEDGERVYTIALRSTYPDIPGIRNLSNAATFVGSEGWVSVSYSRVATNPASLVDSVIGPNEIHLQQSDSHQLSWIECVKTRKDPVSPVESAVRSNVIPHLSDICIRTGHRVRWDPVKETIVGDQEARRMMSRPMRKPWRLS